MPIPSQDPYKRLRPQGLQQLTEPQANCLAPIGEELTPSRYQRLLLPEVNHSRSTELLAEGNGIMHRDFFLVDRNHLLLP